MKIRKGNNKEDGKRQRYSPVAVTPQTLECIVCRDSWAPEHRLAPAQEALSRKVHLEDKRHAQHVSVSTCNAHYKHVCNSASQYLFVCSCRRHWVYRMCLCSDKRVYRVGPCSSGFGVVEQKSLQRLSVCWPPGDNTDND